MEKVETKPDDTVQVETTGKETTTAGAAEAVVTDAPVKETPAAEAVKPEGQTAFAAAAEGGKEKPAGVDEKPKGEEAASEEKPAEEEKPESDLPAVEQALAEVELPEGIIISDADRAALTEIGTKHELSKDAVKELVELQTKREQARMEQIRTAQQEFISEMRAEAEKLPKETLAAAHRYVQKYGSKSLQAKMADPAFYIGNDVDIINAFAIAQKAVDGGFVDGAGGTGGSEKSAGDKLYGK